MATVVFADVVGSTGLFQRLGDEAASHLVSRLLASLGTDFAAHHGRVVKMLGDGVLALFGREVDALAACASIQRRLTHEPVYAQGSTQPVQLQMGIESGEVVEIDGDCFGDTVNSASRLADLAGAAQIFTTRKVWSALPAALQGRLRSLGPIHLRGRSEATHVYRVHWQTGSDEDATTLGRSVGIELSQSALDLRVGEQQFQMHVYSPRMTIGRGSSAVVLLNDPRVSRVHAAIECRGGQYVLLDTSSYGTWVYFGNQEEAVVLRRTECYLAGSGQISAGCERRKGMPVIEFSVGNT